jgi:hypothetical protein
MIKIVIPLHHSGGKEGDNIELRYALRGWDLNMKDPFQITIIGKILPSWINGAHFIHQPKGGLKTALRIAADTYPDGFLWTYDDTIPIRSMTAQEVKTPVARAKFSTAAPTSWSKQLLKVHDRLAAAGIPPIDFSRPHCPYWFTKAMIDEAFKDWPGMSGKFPIESWILSKRRVPYQTGIEKQYYGRFKTPPDSERHAYVNCADGGWTPELKAWLSSHLPDPSPFENKASDAQRVPMRKVYFVHIPKTAGLSLISAFGDQLVRAHRHRHRTWQDKRNLKAWNDSGRLPVTACVRNPIDRAISTYHFWKIYSFLRREVHQIQIQKIARGTDLSTFWETLDLEWAARHVRHFKTQSEFLRGATVTHLLRFEHLAEDFRQLAITLGKKNTQLPHKNAAPRGNETLSPAAEARIRAFYAEDFATWYPRA